MHKYNSSLCLYTNTVITLVQSHIFNFYHIKKVPSHKLYPIMELINYIFVNYKSILYNYKLNFDCKTHFVT